jgi:hypothetical protein
MLDLRHQLGNSHKKKKSPTNADFLFQDLACERRRLDLLWGGHQQHQHRVGGPGGPARRPQQAENKTNTIHVPDSLLSPPPSPSRIGNTFFNVPPKGSFMLPEAPLCRLQPRMEAAQTKSRDQT